MEKGKSNVRLTQSAWIDYFKVEDYISRVLQNPNAAKLICAKIMSACESLAIFPLRNPIYHANPWKKFGVRLMIVENYLILYCFDEQTGDVNVLRIMYSKKDTSNK